MHGPGILACGWKAEFREEARRNRKGNYGTLRKGTSRPNSKVMIQGNYVFQNFTTDCYSFKLVQHDVQRIGVVSLSTI